MANVKSVMIVGVGGQGSLLASRLLGHVLMARGYDVKVSEVHGMAQRGGSVVTYVRYGEKVCSPVITEGEADVVVSFERLEAARWLPFLKRGGKLIVNDQRISPMPVITGAMAYPDDIIEKMKTAGVDVLALDALALAIRAGSAKTVNVVLMGALSTLLDLPGDDWMRAIEECVPAKLLEMNRKAFGHGRTASNLLKMLF